MKDLMIDLETIDTRVTAGILSIGAVIFDLESQKLGKVLRLNIGISDALKNGSRDEETIDWWYQQDTELRKKQFYPPSHYTTKRALILLGNFIQLNMGGSFVMPWSNGSCFDISILQHKYEELGLEVPWEFRNIRDVRTVCKLAKVKSGDFDFIGKKHDPVADCKHQIKMVQTSYGRLML